MGLHGTCMGLHGTCMGLHGTCVGLHGTCMGLQVNLQGPIDGSEKYIIMKSDKGSAGYFEL